MLQNKFEMPLDLTVKESKLFKIYLFIIFFLSIISLFISSLSIIIQLFLCVLLLSFFVFIIRKQNAKKITSLKISSGDEWEIEINNHERFDAELQGECIVTYFLVWLNFTTCNSFGRKQTFHLLLLPDSTDKDLLRKLRVRLRFLKVTKDKDAEVEGIL